MSIFLARFRSGRRAVPALLVASAAVFASPGLAAAQHDAQGPQALRAVEDGQRSCDDLQEADFEQVGEYVMGGTVGSARVHEPMDAMMRNMLGSSGERRMHVALGQRFAGCGQGGFPAGAAGMMNGAGGMMGILGMISGSGTGSGMMGAGSSDTGSAYGSDGYSGAGGTMMGFDRAADDDDSPGAGMAIVMLVLIVGAAVAVFVVVRTRRAASAPLDVLAQRFARGEMTAEDYQQRRALLEGGKR